MSARFVRIQSFQRGKAMSIRSQGKLDLGPVLGAMRSRSGSPVAYDMPDQGSTPLLRYDTEFTSLPAYRQMTLQRDLADALGLRDPYYQPHQGLAGATSRMENRSVINFASYDYLGFNGDPRVVETIESAVRTYGSSVSASRISAGERDIHRALEAALAKVYEAEAAVVFVSGHATAVSTIATLLGPKDLILYDALIHNCIAVGAQLSGAARRAISHNDLDALEAVLIRERNRFNRVLIAVEGLYSMDGDGPDLARLVEIKRRWGAWLLVDDAHGLGVLGRRGHGIAEHLGVDPREIDIWLGTLSKTLVSCGGYVAGSSELADLLKHLAPGLVYSVGLPAGQAAAALKALDLMQEEPERIIRLHDNSRYFQETAQAHGLDTGTSWGFGIVPVYVGDSLRTVMLAEKLLEQGVNAFPILPPGVPELTARLRFFITAAHTREQLATAARLTAETLAALPLVSLPPSAPAS